MCTEELVHDRPRAPALALGARIRPRGRTGAARPPSGQDTCAPPDGGSSVPHNKFLDWIDAFPDENAGECHDGVGALRSGLQYETLHEHHRRWRLDSSKGM